MLELVTRSAAPFSRSSFVPGHFTASSFVVDSEGKRLLLILHPKLGRWLQPGGHVEPGDEDIEAAARREVREEVGLDALEPHPSFPGIFDLDVHAIPAIRSDPEHLHFDVRFLFRTDGREVSASRDVLDWRWVELGEVNRLESDDSVMRAVLKIARLARDL